MFPRASLIASVTLALLVVGTPTTANSANKDEAGVTIPLAQRSSLTKDDGYFDDDKAVRQIAATKNKHRQNLINLQRNMGVEAFNEGASILPFTTVSDSASRRQNEPLADEENDLEWAGMIAIGTPSQGFLIDFDTGSADLWVPSSACKSTTCSGKNKYNAAGSSTSKKQSGTFQIEYGDGSTVSGPEYTDTVTVASISVTQQYFSPVTTMSSSFQNDPIDGIFGLAYPAISNLGHSAWVNSACAQGALPACVFSMRLTRNGSELYLGGTNNAKYTGAIEAHPVNPSSGFWQLRGAAALVNGKPVVMGFQTIIDSGTTLMYGPPRAVQAFYAQVPGAKVYDRRNGMYTVPCGRVPNVGFSWGGKVWPISQANFNLGMVTPTDCVGALMGQDLGLGSDIWLLGDSFMKNVYSVFSFDQNTVGFAVPR